MNGSPDRGGFMTPEEVQKQIDELDNRQRNGADFYEAPKSGVLPMLQKFFRAREARLNAQEKSKRLLRENEGALLGGFVHEVPNMLLEANGPISTSDILSALQRVIHRAFALIDSSRAPQPHELLDDLYRIVVGRLNSERDHSKRIKLQEIHEVLTGMFQSKG